MLFLFWMLYFIILKAGFLIYERHQLAGAGWREILAVFLHGLRLDISAASWLMVFPFLIYLIQSLWPRPLFDRIIRGYVLLMILILAAITTGEMGVFDEWRTKLHYKALLYLVHPSEVVNSAGTGNFLILSTILLAISALAYFLYRKLFFVRTEPSDRKPAWTVVYTLILPVLLVTGMRGGFQQIPVNESSCYYSRRDILNLTAINAGWNLMHSVVENRFAMSSNPFEKYSKTVAEARVRKIMQTPCDRTLQVLNARRPNIVLIILEGWSAELMASLGGDRGITPFSDTLAGKGILFKQFYNSGTRSQQGISAIFSSYPAFPYSTITQHPSKYRKLPFLTNKLDSLGYETSFTFGGSLDYGNIRSYLNAQAFDHITEQKDLSPDLPSGKLGIHDEYMLPVFLEQLDQLKPPFFSALFTVSTHTPYDQDMPDLFSAYPYESRFLNAAHYSDGCLKDFFTQAQNRSWYQNTLFVLVSDHSHVSYRNVNYFEPEYNRIVCMLYGDVIKPEYRGMQVSKHGSQVDLAPTLLAQLEVSKSEFTWGKDMLNPCSPDFGYYSFEIGFGWVRPWGVHARNYKVDYPFLHTCDSVPGHSAQMLEIEGTSYLQVLYDDFLRR